MLVRRVQVQLWKQGYSIFSLHRSIVTQRFVWRWNERCNNISYLVWLVNDSLLSENVYRRIEFTIHDNNDMCSGSDVRKGFTLREQRFFSKSVLEETSTDGKQQTSINPNNRQRNDACNKNQKHQTIALNKRIAKATDCEEVLSLIQNDVKILAGGDICDGVTISTSIHRLAKFSLRDKHSVVDDHRFVLLLASLAEALVSTSPNKEFDFRGMSNVAWGIAKLGISQSASLFPLADSDFSDGNDVKSFETSMLSAATNLRNLVSESKLEHPSLALEMKSAPNTFETTNHRRLALSRLAAQILDYVGIMILFKEGSDKEIASTTQAYSNLLWALTTANRVNPLVYGVVVREMIKVQQFLIEKGSDGNCSNVIDPQHWSNAIWVVSVFRFPHFWTSDRTSKYQ
jgi:hypothetical protein